MAPITPTWGVNRGQMAAFLARAMCGGDDFVPTGPATASFTDVPPDFGFYRYIGRRLHRAPLMLRRMQEHRVARIVTARCVLLAPLRTTRSAAELDH